MSVNFNQGKKYESINPLTDEDLNVIEACADIDSLTHDQVISLIDEIRRLKSERDAFHADCMKYEKWISEVVDAYKRDPNYSQLLNVGRAITWRVEHPEGSA